MQMDIDIGIPQQQRAAIAQGLSRLLADSYTLYLKTHNYHWNVTGPLFNTLHTMFETQYTELAVAVDEIAERIRALGFPAPGSYAAFAELTSITEETGQPSAVIATLRFVRSTSWLPSSVSSSRMATLNADCETWQLAAARPKCLCSARAAK